MVNDELQADLLVAADGIRSVVRGTLYPQYAGPRYSGFTAYRGIADVDLDDGGGETWGRGQLFGFARLIDGRFYWYGTANQPAGTASEPTVFESWHDPIPWLIAASEKILQNDIHDLTTPLMPFARGRIVLLGDAAHAMTPNLGQGAAQALEDAVGLGASLRDADDVESALRLYESRRVRRANALLRASRQAGATAQLDSPLACRLRDAVVAALPARLKTAQQRRFVRAELPRLDG
jgi:2-polyprenyl-6-methoxyphenol hydroxylase-like FAD-dependent oxidoreductase